MTRLVPAMRLPAMPPSIIMPEWANGLKMALWGNGAGTMLNVVNNRRDASTFTWPTTPIGYGLRTTLAGSHCEEVNFTTGAWSVAYYGYITTVDLASNISLFGQSSYSSESNNKGWSLGVDSSSGKWRFGVFNNNGFANYNLLSPSVHTVGAHMLVGTTDGTTRTLYVDGRSVASTGVNPSAAATVAGTGALFLGRVSSGSGAVSLQSGYGWQRCLSAADVWRLWQQPFGVFAERRSE